MWIDEIPLQFEDGHFTKFLYSPMCYLSSHYHRNGQIKDYLTKTAVEDTVSVLMVLATASAKFQRKQATSIEREVVSFSSSAYVRQGFLVSDKETQTFVDKGVRFHVEGIELGLEEILIVTTEIVR